MLERLNPTPVLRGHWKGLTNFGTRVTPDWLTRGLLLIGSTLLVGLAYWKNWELPAATALLAGAALLVGATLSAYSSLSSMRIRLGEVDDEGLDVDRDAIDESVAHVLTLTLLCVVDVVLIVIGMNASPIPTIGGISGGLLASLTIGVSSYMAGLFFVIVPRLYAAYVGINGVSKSMSGFDAGRSDRV